MPLAPLVVKNTTFFEQNGNGWTESFYTQGITTDLNAHAAYLKTVTDKRRLLIGKNTSIRAYRVSFESGVGGEPLKGDSFLVYYGQAGFSTEPSAAPTVALLATWHAGGGQRRKHQFMRGIWDAVESEGGAYIPSYGTWQTKFDQWVMALGAALPGVKAAGAGWLRRTPAYTNTIVNYVADASEYVTFETLNPIPVYVPGPPPSGVPRFIPVECRVTKLNTTSVLNGSLNVTVLDNTHFRTTKPIAAGVFRSAGQVSFYDPNLMLCDVVPATGLLQITPQKIVERKVGTPLLESRGRSKGKPRV